MAVPFVVPRARFFDANGLPLSGGRVTFYAAGTSSLKEVYTTAAGDIEATNPHVLDADGYVRDGGVWLGLDHYDILVEQSDGSGGWVELWTMESIPGSGSSVPTALTTQFVGTIDDLRGLTAGSYSLVYVAGYSNQGDGGGGWFRWGAGVLTADNLGTIIAPNVGAASGKWLRIVGDIITSAEFGCVAGDAGPHNGRISNMIAWAGHSMQWEILRYTYNIGAGTLALSGVGIVRNGAYFTGSGATLSITSTAVLIESTGALVDATSYPTPNVNLSISSTISSRWFSKTSAMPEWFGCVGNGIANNSNAFYHFCASIGKNPSILSGKYRLATGLTFAEIAPIIGSDCVLEYTATTGQLLIAPRACWATGWLRSNVDHIHIPSSASPQASWYASIGSDWDLVVDGLTYAGTIANTLQWSDSDVDFDTAYTGDASKLVNIFDGPCNIGVPTSGRVNFGRIIAGDFQLFGEIDGTINIYSGWSNIYWCGAVKSTASDNEIANSLKIVSDASVMIDGRNASVVTAYEIAYTSASGSLSIKDLRINASISAASLFALNADVQGLNLENVYISSNVRSLYSDTQLGLTAKDCTYLGGVVCLCPLAYGNKFTRCRIEEAWNSTAAYAIGLDASVGSLELRDCDLRYSTQSSDGGNNVIIKHIADGVTPILVGNRIVSTGSYRALIRIEGVTTGFSYSGTKPVISGNSIYQSTLQVVNSYGPCVSGNFFGNRGSAITSKVTFDTYSYGGVMVGNSIDPADITNSGSVLVANNG